MKSIIFLLRDSYSHFVKHNGSRMGAALSYYAIFAIAPLTILVVALVGSIFGTHLTQNSIITELDKYIGSGAGEFIQTIMNSITKQSLGVAGTLISIGVILFATLSVLNVLNTSIDELWELPVEKKSNQKSFISRMWHTIKSKFLVFSVVPVMAVLFLFFIATSVFFSLFHDQFTAIQGVTTLIKIAEPLALFIFSATFFTLLYRILPNTILATRELLIGGLVTSLFFITGRFLIGWYIASFAHTTLYGAAGSLVAILIWIYYSSQVFFFGASFTYVYSKRNN